MSGTPTEIRIPTDARIPPTDEEAEMCVLGAMMLDRRAADAAIEIVRVEDFHLAHNRIIFSAMASMAARDEPVDLVTLINHLRKDPRTAAACDVPYLGGLLHKVPTAANVTHYAKIVASKALLRRISDVASRIYNQTFRPDADAETILEEAERTIMELRRTRYENGPEPFSIGLPAEMKRLDEIARRGGSITGVPTSFKDLDDLTGGLQRGNIIIIAGRPGMGKTVLIQDLAIHAGRQASGAVLIFSIEMSRTELYQRVLASGGGVVNQQVDSSRLRTPAYLTGDEWSRLASTTDNLSPLPVYVDDTPGISVPSMRSRARRLKASAGLTMIVVDYIQLLRGVKNDGNRNNELAAISQDLKQMAREMDCPVIVISQLSRGVDQRADKRPLLSDLRDSGSLEADADIVAFLYRESVYTRQKSDPVPDFDPTELIISKQRSGPTGMVRLLFCPKYQRFTGAAPAWMNPTP